ncbi:MAG: TraR/DksA C4-type zinc finger protein [Planctomycetota bacterium]
MPASNRDTIHAHLETTLRRLVASRQVGDRARTRAAAVALKRMSAGTYGFCSVCGLQIPELRLQTKPEATRCALCEREGK